MSFTGFGARRGGNGNEEGTQGGRRGVGVPPGVQEQEELGDRLRLEARNTFREATGHLREVLNRHYWDLPANERPSENDVITSVARFVVAFDQQLTVAQATRYLANAAWDGDLATNRLHEDIRRGDLLLDITAGYDITRVAGAGNDQPMKEPSGDGGSVEDTDTDVETTEESDEDEANMSPRSKLRSLNAGVNRAAALKGKRDDSKKEIKITLLNGLTKHVKYAVEVDWHDPESIRSLNRWRSQLFRRRLGEVRPYRANLHPLEKRFLVDTHVNFRRAQNAMGRSQPVWSEMDWTFITLDFNNNFRNRTLPGETVPRPERTEGGLRSARPRIPEIVAMTGIKPRHTEKRGEKEEGEDGGKDEGKGPPKKGDKKDEGGKERGGKK